MTLVLQPKTTVNIVGANLAAENTPQKALYVGQFDSSVATVANGVLVENVQIGQEDTLFGPRSMLAHMIREARKINPITRFDAIGLEDNGAGTASAGAVTFTGTATEAGSIYVTIGSSLQYTFEVAVADTDTATVVGDALVALLAASDVPVTGVNTAGAVALTFLHKGLLGNGLLVTYSGIVAGVTTALTAFTGGAGDPTFTSMFDVVGTNRYQGIAWPYFYNVTEVRTFLDARFNVENKVLDGVAITSGVESIANALSALNALNSQSLAMFWDKTTDEAAYKGGAQPAFVWDICSQFTATRALRLTDGANLGQYVLSSNGLLDSFGGAALASKPYFNTPTPYMPLVGTGRGWTDSEVSQLDAAGGSVAGNNVAGNATLVGEMLTTYKNDPAGNADISFKYLNYVDTASNCREYFYNNLRSRFAQSRLTEGDAIQGRDMANALIVNAFCVKLYQDLSGADFVLLEAGEVALNFFKGNLNVSIDKANGIVTITMIVPLVTQLREIQAVMKIAFSTQG